MDHNTIDRAYAQESFNHQRCREEMRGAINSLRENHNHLEDRTVTGYNNLENKLDRLNDSITQWMLAQTEKVGKIDGKLVTFSAISGTVGGAIIAAVVKLL